MRFHLHLARFASENRLIWQSVDRCIFYTGLEMVELYATGAINGIVWEDASTRWLPRGHFVE